MFITHKKGLKLDGNNPTLLYGYGGFNISLTPAFSRGEPGVDGDGRRLRRGQPARRRRIRRGWHQAGTKLQKQNVFDDFIAAAEWLIANKYTSRRSWRSRRQQRRPARRRVR
jgi:prolyl oligopeptidase